MWISWNFISGKDFDDAVNFVIAVSSGRSYEFMSDENEQVVDFNDPHVDFDDELAKRKALGPNPHYSMFIVSLPHRI